MRGVIVTQTVSGTEQINSENAREPVLEARDANRQGIRFGDTTPGKMMLLDCESVQTGSARIWVGVAFVLFATHEGQN